eukprot:TRINITY_DN9552_c0_g1_i3.p2 TRINITY_DN9552_c0_g1~~TRINITY_DN9552_c0_g1_i3.p2  ORF type:complete len:472 (+),score=82.78 TRINITY_DN9552_c0_g1_i3:151-1566(+)
MAELKNQKDQRELQLDMDVLEPYKIRLRVEVLNSKSVTTELVNLFNKQYSSVTFEKSNVLLKFYDYDIKIDEINYEWHRKLQAFIFICDLSLFHPQIQTSEIVKMVMDIRKNCIVCCDVRHLIFISESNINTPKLLILSEELNLKAEQVISHGSLESKAKQIFPMVKEIVSRSLEIVRKDMEEPLTPKKVPWKLLCEEDKSSEELASKFEIRSRKWKIELSIKAQENEGVERSIKNAMECQGQSDLLWIASLHFLMATVLARRRMLEGKELLIMPAKKDEVISSMNAAIAIYNSAGRADLELETLFRLANTYKSAKLKYEMIKKFNEILKTLRATSSKSLIRACIHISAIYNELGLHHKAVETLYLEFETYKYQREYAAAAGCLARLLETAGLNINPKALIFKNYEDAVQSLRLHKEKEEEKGNLEKPATRYKKIMNFVSKMANWQELYMNFFEMALDYTGSETESIVRYQ